MTFTQFHNAMRILFNIDADEFIQAVYGRDTKPPDDSREWKDWKFFRDHPHEWFLRAPTEKAEAIYAIIEARQPHVHVKDTSRPTDACAKCGRDLRDQIHERVQP